MQGSYSYLNFKKNNEIYTNLKIMNEKREIFEEKLQQKLEKLDAKKKQHEFYKEETFKQIEEFFDIIVKKALERKQQLKD